MSTPDILKTSELADLLGCAETTIEERARKGELPGLKYGDKGWVFPREALLSHLNVLATQEAAGRRKRPEPVMVVVPRGKGELKIGDLKLPKLGDIVT